MIVNIKKDSSGKRKSDWYVGPPPTILTLKIKQKSKNPECNDTIKYNDTIK